MNGFTAGPWRSGDRFNTVFGPPSGNPSPQTIATVAKGNEANARLIAAAPELLAACEAALTMPSGIARPLSGDEVRQVGDIVKQLRAAIAKAGGGQ